MNRTEYKVVEKIALAMFAEHLYDGLTSKHNYGLVEATRHWHAAKNDPLEYAFIEYPIGTDTRRLMGYLNKLNDLMEKLETYLKEQGTLGLDYDALEAFRKSHNTEIA